MALRSTLPAACCSQRSTPVGRSFPLAISYHNADGSRPCRSLAAVMCLRAKHDVDRRSRLTLQSGCSSPAIDTAEQPGAGGRSVPGAVSPDLSKSR